MFYYSPYVIIHAALGSVVCGSFILFLCMLVCSVFFGRLFCGYVCAGAGFGEMAGCINEKAPKLGRLRYIKYVIWFIWLAIVTRLYITNGGLRHFDPFYGTKHGISVAAVEEYPVYLLVVLLLFGVPLVCGKRAFCHYLCWMAPFMNLGMKIRRIFRLPGIRIKVEKERCIDCKLCNKSCTMGLDVHEMVQDGHVAENDCSMCGACVDICPRQAVHYGWNNN